MQAKFATTLGLLLAIHGQLTGCAPNAYPLAPVSGRVTLDGQPLAGAAVVFQPKFAGDSGEVAPGSVGRTNEIGRYALMTVNDEPGAAPGTHKVRIYSYSPESAPVGDTDAREGAERGPGRYNYRRTLVFEVPEEGTDAADFQLTTDAEN